MKLDTTLMTAALAPVFTSLCAAQSTDWATFVREDSRISAPSALVLQDSQEKDMAWGDFDRDGWIDLLVVRKQPFTTQGRYRNVLLMNESGTLTERTSQYASASSVSGDQGFLTPTNDRDVAVGDLDGDGTVGGGDLGVLFVQWGGPGSGDLDGDGIVGGGDLGILFVGWGPCP